jgi:hypothetical protein
VNTDRLALRIVRGTIDIVAFDRLYTVLNLIVRFKTIKLIVDFRIVIHPLRPVAFASGWPIFDLPRVGFATATAASTARSAATAFRRRSVVFSEPNLLGVMELLEVGRSRHIFSRQGPDFAGA